MTTKVNHTVSHKTSQGEVIVTKGKLVLIIPENKTGDDGYFRFNNGIYFKPIIVSEIESIETSDNYYNAYNEKIYNAPRFEGYKIGRDLKVLVLPTQFSTKQLQAIIEGKLKDGDEVLVECKPAEIYGNNGSFYPIEYVIKLSYPDNKVTLHKVEQKLYTREELENYIELAWASCDSTLSKEEIKKDCKSWISVHVK